MGRHKQAAPFVDAELKAPATLSRRAREIFEATVAAVDVYHFSAVDTPLLCQYAGAAELAEQAQLKLDEEGAVVAGKSSPWLNVLEKSSRSCVALSARLRICPQSRYDRLVAGTNARQQYAGKKLWEGDYDQKIPKVCWRNRSGRSRERWRISGGRLTHNRRIPMTTKSTPNCWREHQRLAGR